MLMRQNVNNDVILKSAYTWLSSCNQFPGVTQRPCVTEVENKCVALII